MVIEALDEFDSSFTAYNPNESKTVDDVHSTNHHFFPIVKASINRLLKYHYKVLETFSCCLLSAFFMFE